jgi:hypothetical protein
MGSIHIDRGRWMFPYNIISVDFIVKLPQAHGYDVIMVVVDSVTKQAQFLPTHMTINAEGTTRLYLREVWKHHGLPRAVLSDQGSQFIAEFTCKVYQWLGIKLVTLTLT